MSRICRVTFEKVSIAAAEDLFEISPASGKIIRIIHRWLGCSDDGSSIPAAQMVALRERYLPATVTHGSGGTTPAIVALDPGDSLSNATVRANATTKASTSGTAVILWEEGTHLYNGYDDSLDSPYIISPGAAYVFEILTAFSPSVKFSGGIEFEEIGG